MWCKAPTKQAMMNRLPGHPSARQEQQRPAAAPRLGLETVGPRTTTQGAAAQIYSIIPVTQPRSGGQLAHDRVLSCELRLPAARRGGKGRGGGGGGQLRQRWRRGKGRTWARLAGARHGDGRTEMPPWSRCMMQATCPV